ncbi:hypothetical protein [Halocola ammonii]
MKRLIFLLPVLFTLLLLSSCEKEDETTCEEHTVAPCAVDTTQSNIRVKNVSDYDFCNVVIDPNGNLTNYGIIEKGETTCYRPFETAYRYAYVNLIIEEKEFILQPIDFVGEQPLGTGNFTYSIDVSDFENRTLSIEASED